METAVVVAAYSPSCQHVLQHCVAAVSGICWDNVSECFDGRVKWQQENTTICWFKQNVFFKARFISCVKIADCLWYLNNL